MGELLEVLVQVITVECLDRPDDPRVKFAAALVQETAVSDVVREGMLECVFESRRQSGFEEEVSVLQMGESAAECLVRQLGDGLKQAKGRLRADDRGDLQQVLLCRRQ